MGVTSVTKPAVKHVTITVLLLGLLGLVPLLSHANAKLVLLAAITLSAWLVGDRGRRVAVAVVSIGGVAVGISILEAVYPQFTPSLIHRRIGWIFSIVGLVLLLYCASIIVISLFNALDVSMDEVAGAVNVYLIVAFLWAHAYHLLEKIRPGSFGIAEPTAESFPILVYFSIVTLTTLGYGDITPVTPAARVLVTFEAILGQIYVPVVVGYLLSLHISRKLNR